MSRRDDLDAALHHISALLDLAHWHFVSNAKRDASDRGQGEYRMSVSDGDQLAALLAVTREYAMRELADLDSGARREA